MEKDEVFYNGEKILIEKRTEETNQATLKVTEHGQTYCFDMHFGNNPFF